MNTFYTFLTQFHGSKVWADMVLTVENSPWHREANVAVHTQMALDQYTSRFASVRTPAQNMVAMIALLFHDAGKPAAEEVFEKTDGSGVYRRYSGHEQDSAMTFMEFYLSSAQLRSLVTPLQARAIRWIIEHHLPYGFKDVKKRHGLAEGTFTTLQLAGIPYETFFDCLRSDAAGRISDDHEFKLQNVEEWILEFQTIPVLQEQPASRISQRTVYLLIGPSASGKSSYTKNNLREHDQVFSLDDCRIEHFVANVGGGYYTTSPADEYSLAWIYAENDPDFHKVVSARIKSVFSATRGNIYIDNTNLSRKSRTQFVQLGRKSGMQVVGVEFWNTLETLISRQATRAGKCVPDAAVKRQFYSSTSAWIGMEVDRTELIISFDGPAGCTALN